MSTLGSDRGLTAQRRRLPQQNTDTLTTSSTQPTGVSAVTGKMSNPRHSKGVDQPECTPGGQTLSCLPPALAQGNEPHMFLWACARDPPLPLISVPDQRHGTGITQSH